MKSMTLHVTLTLCCLAALVLAGCATPEVQGYRGDPRPSSEIAKVSLPTFLDCSHADGKRVWGPLWVEFLPGEHSLRVAVVRHSKGMRYKGDPVTASFLVEAGHKYRMKICMYCVDARGDIYDPHYYFVHKQGGPKSAALHALGLKDPDGWLYLDWLPQFFEPEVSWTPYLVDEADGSLAPHPDPKVAKAVEDLLGIVKRQQNELWQSGR